jgi:hypothetical protein
MVVSLHFRLQRLLEDFEYSEILDKAAQCTDDCEQVRYSRLGGPFAGIESTYQKNY